MTLPSFATSMYCVGLVESEKSVPLPNAGIVMHCSNFVLYVNFRSLSSAFIFLVTAETSAIVVRI